MDYLPSPETDIADLTRKGYVVSYENGSSDNVGDLAEFMDCYKEVVTKDGMKNSPDDLPTVKYFSRENGALVGALWHVDDVLHRDDSPSSVCDMRPIGSNYFILAYHQNGVVKNPNGAGILGYLINDRNELITEFEQHFENGKKYKWICRDTDGEIIPDGTYIPDNEITLRLNENSFDYG